MIYFDNAASTPLDEKVLEAMLPYLKQEYGNPSSVHEPGRHGRAALEMARVALAHTLHASPKEIILTSGATESVNAIHKGVVFASQAAKKHLVVSTLEHHCVLDCVAWLERQGVSVTWVNPDAEGFIDPQAVKKAIRPGETLLVSIMAANNEVGSIQPFAEIGAIVRQAGALFHTDAVQAYGKLPIDVVRDSIDFLSVSAHKIYGPKGTGFFYLRRGVQLVPLVHGGGQEFDLRGGTENVAGAVGLAEAAKRVFARPEENQRLTGLAQELWKGVQAAFPSARLNGPKDFTRRVPGLLNITFPGVSAESLVQALDGVGFAASPGAACSAGSAPPSHVLLAMGQSESEAKQGLRISLGHGNDAQQVEAFVRALPDVVRKLQTRVSFDD